MYEANILFPKRGQRKELLYIKPVEHIPGTATSRMEWIKRWHVTSYILKYCSKYNSNSYIQLMGAHMITSFNWITPKWILKYITWIKKMTMITFSFWLYYYKYNWIKRITFKWILKCLNEGVASCMIHSSVFSAFQLSRSSLTEKHWKRWKIELSVFTVTQCGSSW